jgi:hypothetical protein
MIETSRPSPSIFRIWRVASTPSITGICTSISTTEPTMPVRTPETRPGLVFAGPRRAELVSGRHQPSSGAGRNSRLAAFAWRLGMRLYDFLSRRRGCAAAGRLRRGLDIAYPFFLCYSRHTLRVDT